MLVLLNPRKHLEKQDEQQCIRMTNTGFHLSYNKIIIPKTIVPRILKDVQD